MYIAKLRRQGTHEYRALDEVIKKVNEIIGALDQLERKVNDVEHKIRN